LPGCAKSSNLDRHFHFLLGMLLSCVRGQDALYAEVTKA